MFSVTEIVSNPSFPNRTGVKNICQRIKLTKTLRSSSLKQIVDCRADDDTLAARMDSKAPDLNAVSASDVLDEWWFTHDLNELLPSVTVLVEVTNIARRHRLLQRQTDRVL